MKKLSLRRVLKELEEPKEPTQNLVDDDFGEEDEVDGAPEDLSDIKGENPKDVWGGPDDDDLPPRGRPAPSAPSLDSPDNMDRKSRHLAARYKLTKNDLESISRGDFSGVARRVGDLGNFAEDVADVFGREVADKASEFALDLAPNKPMRLGPMYDRIHANPPPDSNQSTVQHSNTNHNIPMAHAPTQMTDPNINQVRPTPPEPNPTKPRVRPPQNR